MNPAPVFFFNSTATPSPSRPCDVGAGILFSGASFMHGYLAIMGCEVDVISVSSQWQLKYNFYVMVHRKERKERKGRKANPTESFAVFAVFAVRQ